MSRKGKAPRPEPRRGRRSAAAFAAAALAALALVLQTDRARDRMAASKRLRAVEVLSERMARAGRAPGQLVGRHFVVLREAAELDPSEVGVPVALGGQHMLLGQPERAIEVYQRALALEPRPETYLNLGQALLAAGRREEAREAYEKAVRLAPNLVVRVPADFRP